jgi:hypothetical protein
VGGLITSTGRVGQGFATGEVSCGLVELQVICPTTRREINNVGRRREGGGGNVINTRHKGGDSGKMAKMVKSTGLERKFAYFTIV